MSLNLILSGFAIITALIIGMPQSNKCDQSIKLTSYALFTTTVAGALRLIWQHIWNFLGYAFLSKGSIWMTQKGKLGLVALICMDVFSFIRLTASIFMLAQTAKVIPGPAWLSSSSQGFVPSSFFMESLLELHSGILCTMHLAM
jgi:hypothetical protein